MRFPTGREIRRFVALGALILLILGPWSSWSAGQVKQSAPQTPAHPAGDSPIIQPPPGTETGTDRTPAAPMFSEALTLDDVDSRLKAMEANPDLDTTKKESLKATYQQAIADLKKAADDVAKASELAKETQAMPAEIEQAKKNKESLSKPAPIEIPEEATLTELQQELALKEEALGKVKSRLDEAVNEIKSWTAKRGESTQLRKATEDQLAETERELNTSDNAGTAPETLAKRTKLRAQWQRLRASKDRMAREDAWQSARKDLLPLERDIAALEVEQLEKVIQVWRDAVAKERQAELDREKAEAEAQARRAQTFKKYPSIAEHANEIVELAELRQENAVRIPEVVEQLDKTTSELGTLKENFKQSRERVQAAGDTMNVGTLLRLQQKKLPDTRELARNIYARQDEIQELQLALYDVSDRAKELSTVASATDELLAELEPAPAKDERERLKTFVKELLETERNRLDSLSTDYSDLVDQLYRLDKVEKQLIEETESYSQFISENVLWIRSCEPLWKQPQQDFRDAFVRLIHPEDWANVLVTIGGDVWDHPADWMISLALFGLLLIQQPKLRRQINEIGKTINKRAMTEFRPTLSALFKTVLVSALLPGGLCWVGYRLMHSLDAPASVSAVGRALFAVGLFYFPVELLRQSCRANGLVQSHFQWPAPVVTMIRRNLRWFRMIVPPLWLITAMFAAAASWSGEAHESFGRVCFIIALLLEALFMHRVLRPSGSAFRAMVADRQGSWVDRLKYVFYTAGVLAPFTLACLASVGYYYTALQLVTRFYYTGILVLGVLFLDALIQRWLLVTRRRLALNQLRQRREAALAQQAQQAVQQAAAQKTAEGAPPVAQSPVVPNPVDANDERLDVSAMNDQTRQLVRSLLFVGVVVGFWGVWVDVLPALAILKKVEIHALTIERVIEEPVPVVAETPRLPGTDPAAAKPSEEQPEEAAPETVQKTVEVPITLADLMLSVIILIAAIAAARNLPGMLEMIVLQRLPIDNAARYAITTLAQYALTIVGITTAFYVVGLRWQNVQWLAAALMVGLGFGLQEIFANFFSGLIVLLERPVRVGDIVTVGNTTGIITRIRMRATTITNWERQEMIIPNKDLITGTVLNWTLSDTVQRVFIQVGVAYGSDTEKATETLYEVLKGNPQVMEDPPPLVTFAGFGDSTLNFEVRCFLPTAAVRLATTHELHTAIDKAFRKAGVEIAFPQMDLHIRSVESGLPFQQVSHNGNSAGGRPQDPAFSKGA